jgi:phenylacetate-CoA ligase
MSPFLDRYLEADIETMPRAEIEALEEERLLELVPYAYERSALIRETWSAARVHPRDIRSLDDFRERVPFIDKDAIRAFRDRHGDPYGGLLCVSEDELTAVQSTSGTTGDPTLVPERWESGERPPPLAREFWEMGVRGGDFLTCMLFTFRGPFYVAAHAIGAVPVFLDHTPFEFSRLIELSLELRPTGLYTLSSVLVTLLMHMAPDLGADLREVFSSYRGVVLGGEPLGLRARRQVEAWGIETFEHTSLGDVGAATECREHDGCHFWEDTAFVEHLEPEGVHPVADGSRGELVVTALENRVAPLVRYRSDDLVVLTRKPCGCGRTHGRLNTLGRKGDEIVVQGRSILPRDLWPAIEGIEETSMGLFQIIREAREVDRLRLRVGHDGSAADVASLGERIAAAVASRVGIDPEVEMIPNDELLKLGPPHKIPRVARR